MVWLSGFIFFMIGASWGSFLNVVAIRRQSRTSFVSGRSRCVRCSSVIAWYDLIPLVSWVALLGRCRSCHKRFSIQYLLVEFFCGVMFVLAAYSAHTVYGALLHFAVISFFTVLFLHDFRSYIVPDAISLPAIVIVGFLNVLAHASLERMLIGAAIGAAWFYVQFAVSRGRWVGGGDIRLGALMGVLLGHPHIWLALLISYVGGSIIAGVLIFARKRTFKSRIPFGTILLPAAYVVWIWGDVLWQWYVSAVGF